MIIVKDRQIIACDFCGETQDNAKIVAGPNNVAICYGCVWGCVEIFAEAAVDARREAKNADH